MKTCRQGKRLSLVAVFVGFSFTAHAGSTTLRPVADAYVRANNPVSSPGKNFGATTSFAANNSSGVRVSLVRFDFSGVTGPVTAARLALTITSAAPGMAFRVYGLIAGESWSETAVTWSNAPGITGSYTPLEATDNQVLRKADLFGNGEALSTFTSGNGSGMTDVAFDVTSGRLLDFINADTDKIVTFLIAQTGSISFSGVSWASREASVGQPLLTVGTGDPAPPNPPPATPTVLRVVLVAGQSNGEGRALASDLPATLQAPQANVPFYYYVNTSAVNADGTLGKFTTLRPGASELTGAFGPEITLGASLSPLIEQTASNQLAVIKYAKGGSTLAADWKAGGDATTTGDGPLYVNFQRVVTAGLAKIRSTYPAATVTVLGMIWIQGENDIELGNAATSVYGANLAQFIADVRQTFAPTLPFLFSRISTRQTLYSSPGSAKYPDYLALRSQQAQIAASVPNTYLIDTDSAAFTIKSDGVHFDAGGQQALGSAFAAVLGDVTNLRITALEPIAGVRVRWNAIFGRSYLVDYSDNGADWTPTSVGMVSEWFDTSNGAAGHPSYRVREAP